MRIGVLAVQGAFVEHEVILQKLGAETFQIRQKRHLEEMFDGLILPGGESTVIGKLIQELGMYDELQRKIRAGLPVFGTCAGLILLAGEICGERQTQLATMDIRVQRNAYGRQLGSFETIGAFGEDGEVPMVFIRAPYIEQVGEAVEIMTVVDEKIVAARQGNQLVTAFHPELTGDYRVHQYFMKMVERSESDLALRG